MTSVLKFLQKMLDQKCLKMWSCLSLRVGIDDAEKHYCIYTLLSWCAVMSLSPTIVLMHNGWIVLYQMIIAVSQLIGNNVIISDSRFTESLSIISSYASNDQAVQVMRQQCLLTVCSCIFIMNNAGAVSAVDCLEASCR